MIIVQSVGREAVLTDRVLDAEEIHVLGPEVRPHNPCGCRVSGERERARETTGYEPLKLKQVTSPWSSNQGLGFQGVDRQEGCTTQKSDFFSSLLLSSLELSDTQVYEP